MSKMAELSAAVAELHRCGEILIGISESLKELFSMQEAPAEAATQAIPEKPPKLEEVRAILAQKSAEGHTPKVQALLRKYGADKLPRIDPAHYAALIADAEVL